MDHFNLVLLKKFARRVRPRASVWMIELTRAAI
jgi:hypothetical protein